MNDDEAQARIDSLTRALRDVRSVLRSLPHVVKKAKDDGGWQFSHGQPVYAKRNMRVLMTVGEQPYSENNATAYYVCQFDATAAQQHSRGKSTRYFREDDLIAA